MATVNAEERVDEGEVAAAWASAGERVGRGKVVAICAADTGPGRWREAVCVAGGRGRGGTSMAAAEFVGSKASDVAMRAATNALLVGGDGLSAPFVAEGDVARNLCLWRLERLEWVGAG